MFAGKNLDGKFKEAKDSGGLPNTAIKRACSLGRIVGVCQYMKARETRDSLLETIRRLHSIL